MLGSRASAVAWAEAQPARERRAAAPGRARRPAQPAPGRCGSSRPRRSACAQRPAPLRLRAHARLQVRAAASTHSATAALHQHGIAFTCISQGAGALLEHMAALCERFPTLGTGYKLISGMMEGCNWLQCIKIAPDTSDILCCTLLAGRPASLVERLVDASTVATQRCALT